MRRLGIAAATVLALGGCSGESDPASTSGPSGAQGTSVSSTASATSGGAGGSAIDYCAACGAPVVAGKVASTAASELSGIVASSTVPGAFYVHNDSGDSARFLAIGSAGEDLGTYQVTGATAVDWEDVARGPCPAGSCIYFADLGDNNVIRKNYVVYRVTEPATLAAGTSTAPGEAIPVAYPDSSHNCEALLVHPVTGTITVVTKVAAGPSKIYELPMPGRAGEMQMLSAAGEVTPPEGSLKITGGDVHPLGAGVLLRTYTHVFYYPMATGQSVADALQGTPCALPVADEGQGEAVAWTIAGDGYVTVGEGDAPPLNAVSCALDGR